MSARHVVFDIGGVLVDWDPSLAFNEPLGGRAQAEAFLERVGFDALNRRADAGTPFADLAAEIDDADDRALLASYADAYPNTVRHRIEGTWALLDCLLAAGTPVHAITNWSAETWPRGLLAQPRLGEVFDVLVVSGREGVAKPDAAIFELFCHRAGVAPQDCLFIDDREENTAAARTYGMDAVTFVSPDALQDDLIEKGLL